MRSAGLAILAMTIGAAGLGASPATAQETSHIRPLSTDARALVEESLQRSPTIQALADVLEESDVAVLVSLSMEPERVHHGACLRFVSTGGTLRFVSVWINLWRTSPDVRIALLGHELQHAVEVSAMPEVRDSASLAVLYTRIGYRSSGIGFETSSARRVERLVAREVAASDPRPSSAAR
ncbi:MAG: hypothetical protein IMZ67_02915 [Acidobacteria bacterium]|nr:hypothetical protein [Acidobacteriota bacterium]